MEKSKFISIKYYFVFVCTTIFLASCSKGVKMNELESKNGLLYLKNKAEVFTGKIHDEYTNGNDSMIAQVDNGLLHGNYIVYYVAGPVKDSVVYNRGIITKHKRFKLDGSILLVPRNNLVLKNNLLYERTSKDLLPFTGLTSERVQSWENKKKFCTHESNYLNGKKNGQEISYYPNGKLEYKISYLNGCKEGNTSWYYSTGELQCEGYHLKGLQSGKWSYFDKNKKISQMGVFRDGKKDSIWTEYYGNGRKKSTTGNLNGRLHGSFIAFYENGNIQLKGAYKNGDRDGDWIWYNLNGSVQGETKYRNGEAMRRCECCGTFYVYSAGWKGLPSGFSAGWFDLMQGQGGPYCSKKCAMRCGGGFREWLR